MKTLRAALIIVFACCALVGSLHSTDVLTYHNDNARTGWNSQEATLTLLNVNAQSFGLIRNLSVDGAVFAQPLHVSNVQVFSNGQAQGVHNLVIVVTEHDSVYAFDADSGALYWHVSMLGSAEIPSDGLGCSDLPTENGITATPVIDRASGPHGTIFLLAMSKTPDNANYYERLHAVDLGTGQDLHPPVTIQASYPGSGPNSDGHGNVIFYAAHQRGRAGLLLTNGTIYTSWGSFCDFPPFNGWIIAYNEQTLAQTLVFNTDPNGTPSSDDLPDGSGSGVWQAGQPPAVDSAGNLYASTGNGPFDTNLDSKGFPASKDYGDTLLKLTPGLQVTSYFTPNDQLSLAENDGDFGSGGPLVVDISDSDNTIHHLVVTAGKDSNIYVVDRDTMGGFSSPINNIYQELTSVLPGGVWMSPAYFNGSIYFDSQGHSLLQFKFNSKATLNPKPASASTATFPFPGGTPSVSSLGNSNGIVWIKELRNGQVILHAYDATNLTHQLYSSAGVTIGAPTKFGPPTVCNGKVFVGTMNSVGVFGLLHPPSGSGSNSDQVASGFVSYSGDFNGDGKQDILWRNTETGEVDIWFMNGASVTAKANVGTIGSEWKIVGIADFNGDGKSDILWKNTLDGTFGIWIMNGAGYSGHGFNSQGSQWSIVGVADIDHTGFADILWRNVVTGELVAWKSGPDLTFNSFHVGTAGLDWNLAGVANLFDSSESALIWQNQNSGEVVAWQLNGNAISAQSSLGTVPLNWTVAGFGDFNADGHQDILWHNSSDGTVVAWMMNGFQVSAKWINQNFMSQNWQIRATPNVAGSGSNSILWSDSQTGEQVLWIPAGSGFSQINIGSAPPPWTVLR
jgi:VCBS repeat protein